MDEGVDPLNTAMAKRNQVDWIANQIVAFDNDDNDTLLYIGLSSILEPGLSDILSLNHVPLHPGTYVVFPYTNPIQKLNSTYHTLLGGDVAYGSYDLDSTASNTLVVESYDAANKIITLSFELSFYAEPDSLFEYVVFKEGKITARIED